MKSIDVNRALVGTIAVNDQRWSLLEEMYQTIIDRCSEAELLALNDDFENAVNDADGKSQKRLLSLCPTFVFALASTAMGELLARMTAKELNRDEGERG